MAMSIDPIESPAEKSRRLEDKLAACTYNFDEALAALITRCGSKMSVLTDELNKMLP